MHTSPEEFELSDLDAERRLLDWPGSSLLIFVSQGCAACRSARHLLPQWQLPVERLCWIDAADSGGLVQRFGVFHLPALFAVRDGQLHGNVHSPLRRESLITALDAAFAAPAEELP